MPKSSNTHVTQSLSHSSAMLNQDNLAQHTQHHHQLNEKRDFVQEFLDALDPSSAPQSDPGLEPVELTLDIVLKGSNSNSKVLTYEPSQQHSSIRPAQQILQYTQQYKQSKYSHLSQIQEHPASHNIVDKRKKISKEHQSPSHITEPRSLLQIDRRNLVDGARRKDGNGMAEKLDTKRGKKRKQDADNVEQNVQDLEIHDPHIYRVKRKRQTDDTHLKSAPQKANNDKKAKKCHGQEDRRVLNQQGEDKRKVQKKRAPLYDDVTNQESSGYDCHSRRRLRQYRHLHLSPILGRNSENTIHVKPAKTDSNKPRKILTHGSLIMNQFVSQNVSRERITIPEKLDHLGIFKKGKASRKTTIQQDIKYGFSEFAFLNYSNGPKEHHLREQCNEHIVTSEYFIDERRNDCAVISKSNSISSKILNDERPNRASTISPSNDELDINTRISLCPKNNNNVNSHRDSQLSQSNADFNQQQPRRRNINDTTPRIDHVLCSEPLEDVLGAMLEFEESRSPLRTHEDAVEPRNSQQSIPIESIPVVSESFLHPHANSQYYECDVPFPTSWQVHNTTYPHEQMYRIDDNLVLAHPICFDISGDA
ncbi:hypothetical protein FBU30_010930 [Linnemannia zychae]|nr:hypothetical protein FBU30_010930 [Linnemannia zychae]